MTGILRSVSAGIGCLVAMAYGERALADYGAIGAEEGCRYSISFSDISGRQKIDYRQTMNNIILWYITVARKLGSGNAVELDNLLQTSAETMELFQKDLKRSVTSRDKISMTLDRLMTQFDEVTSTADLMVRTGENMLREHQEMKAGASEKQDGLNEIIRAGECDLLFLHSVENSPKAKGDAKIGEWVKDMQATIADSLRNVRDVRKSLKHLGKVAFATMAAADQFIKTSLQGTFQQFSTSTTYVFTSFKSMQTSRQYVRMEQSRIRFPTLREITARNVAEIERHVRILLPLLKDLEQTFLGAGSELTPETSSWGRVVESIEVFEEELGEMALALEDWSMKFWEEKIGREVELTCPLEAYQYNSRTQEVDRSTTVVLSVGKIIKIQDRDREIDGERYMIIKVRGEVLHKYHAPIHAAMAVLSASTMKEECRRQQ